MMSLSPALAVGFTVNFPEEPETVMENIREIGPHVMFAPPRIWENLTSTVQVKIMDTTPFKRFMYERWHADRAQGGRPALRRRSPSRPAWRSSTGSAYWALFRALKDRLGFTHLRSASTGGAALGPDVFRFFHAMDVPLKQIYGQTEISGISCIHRDDDIQFHTVGVPIPGTEVRISETGRDPLPQRRRLPRLLQERGGHRRRPSPTAGSTPATPATSPRTATWWSSTASRT